MRPVARAIEAGDVLLGKYRIDALLGRGGMGLVYQAWHLQLNEPLAIKVLRADVQLDAEAVARFKREAQAAVRLKSEHVARIHDVGVFDDETPYIVMELLAGADLGTLVDTSGPTDVATAADLILQACDALAEAHAAGIVHRDIKPSNLFVTTRPDGSHTLKVLDFGISKSATGTDLSLTQTASVLGTPAYMSPEQMRSARRVDARTDVWSLGTVLYELVEARRPFRAETFSEMCVMAAADPYDPLVLAPELDAIIARCLAKSPDHRYQSVAELAAALAPHAHDPQRAAIYVKRTQRLLERGMPTPIPGTLAPAPMPRPAAPPRPDGQPGTLSGDTTVDPYPRRRARLWIALVAVLAGGAAAALALTGDPSPPRAAPVEGPRYELEARTPDAAVPVLAVEPAPASTPIDAGTLPDAATAMTVDAGSPPRPPRPATRIKRRPAVKKPPVPPPVPPPPPPEPPEPAKKKCNVWESRNGC